MIETRVIVSVLVSSAINEMEASDEDELKQLEGRGLRKAEDGARTPDSERAFDGANRGFWSWRGGVERGGGRAIETRGGSR